MTDFPRADVLGGHEVLFVMAAEAEYGSHLQSRIRPLITGIGPVEAAVSLMLALTRMQAAGCLPALIVSLGSAGSRSLTQAHVYQVSTVEYRDMDASALGFEKGATPLLDLPVRVSLPHRIPDVPQASIATGASIVSGAGYDAITADMVDMETFAVLRACQKFGLPMIGLRGISDGIAELVQLTDWTQYLHIIDEKLALAVDQLATALGSGQIRIQSLPINS